MGQEQSVRDKQDESVSKTCPDINLRGIYVLSSSYGDLKTEKHTVDCTFLLQEYLKKSDYCVRSYDGRCLLLSFPHNKKKHDLLRMPDPHKGYSKSLKVVYGLDGAQHTITIGEYEAWTVKSLFIPDSKLLSDCSISSYFDDSELFLLYEDFRVECWPDSVLKRDQFIKLLPIFNNDTILNSFFNLMDKNGDGGIDFSEYARALSIMSRGSSSDKIQLTFELLDLDRNGSLELKEVLLILNEVSKRMVTLGFDEDSFGVVSESVTELFEKRQDKLNQSVLGMPLQLTRMYGIGQITDLFVTPFSSNAIESSTTSVSKSKEEKQHHKKSEKHHLPKEDRGEDVDDGFDSGDEDDGKQDEDFLAASGIKQKKIVLMSSITLYDFKIRAQNDPNIGDAFGMFDYFQKIVIDPVEQRLNKDRDIHYQGWLTKDKGDSLYNKTLSVVSGTDKRYFVVRNGFLAYYKSEKINDPQTKPIRVISLDSAKIMLGLTDSCYLSTPSFMRNLYAPSNRTEIKRFVNFLRKNTGRTFENRSFAPIRWGINARWFINGNQYFEALLKVLARAKKAIYITDWYFSPGLHLCRKGAPDTLDKTNRLDNVLLKRAEAGVKIYVLIWNASAKVFHLESTYVTSYMNGLHENIVAMRHPNWTPIVWSHHQKTVIVDEEIAFLGGIDLCYSRYDDSRYLVVDNDSSTFPGRDYSNLNIIGEENGNPLQSVIDRDKLPRMPWHDIHMQIDGVAARDVGINFIQRWNHAMYQSAGVQFNNNAVYILPITDEDVPSVAGTRSQTTTAQRKQIERSRQGLTHLVEHERDLGYPGCQVQIVRSAALWSAGIEKPEHSIYKAYLKVIHNAEHYIYIENQYFISSIARIRPKNKIAKALWTRLRKAIIQKQQFKVIVVIPVYPAGDLALPATRYIIKYVYKTINRQKNSILEKLHEEFPDVDLNEYIHFCALRNWGILRSGAVVTEQVYVHAKMLLADDRVAIIGSANINDRSMRGTRDSEIAAVLEQEPEQLVESVMGGKPYKVSPYVYDLRMRLWRDYLGLMEDAKKESVEALRDPVSDECYKQLWLYTAQENTSAYLSLFTDLPDKFTTLAEMLEWKKKILDAQQTDSSEMKKWFKNMEDKLRDKVRGFLVFFPLSFLEKEQTELSPGLVTKEYLLPRYVFL